MISVIDTVSIQRKNVANRAAYTAICHIIIIGTYQSSSTNVNGNVPKVINTKFHHKNTSVFVSASIVRTKMKYNDKKTAYVNASPKPATSVSVIDSSSDESTTSPKSARKAPSVDSTIAII